MLHPRARSVPGVPNKAAVARLAKFRGTGVAVTPPVPPESLRTLLLGDLFRFVGLFFFSPLCSGKAMTKRNPRLEGQQKMEALVQLRRENKVASSQT